MSAAKSLHFPQNEFFAHARFSVTFMERSTKENGMFFSCAKSMAARISSPGFTPTLLPMRLWKEPNIKLAKTKRASPRFKTFIMSRSR